MDAILYGKDQPFTLDEVQTSVWTKELQKPQELKIEDNGEGLNNSKRRSEKKRTKGKKSKSKSKNTTKLKFKCFNCHKTGHFKKDCPEKGSKSKSLMDSIDVVVASDGYESVGVMVASTTKSKFKCFNYHKTGHFKKDCPEKESKSFMDSFDDVVASDGYENVGVMVASTSNMQRNWVMDCECTYHMCPMKDFETLELKEGGVVLLGNNKSCKVQGMGTIWLKMFDNCEILLQDVRYVLELKRNLLSITLFDVLGYTARIEHGMHKISNGALIIAKGTKKNGLYIRDASIIIAHASIASQTPHDKTKLWHLKLGHVSERGLVELEKQNLLTSDKLDKLGFCDYCILGKSHGIKFGSGCMFLVDPLTTYSNLRVFNALAFTHVKQDKLDAWAVKCIFIGYPDGVKGYKLWKLDP
ncbi:hypothetical protein CR513_32380, partial [Mucuna pruriens]